MFIREHLGVTLREIGELCGLDKTCVKHRETGRIPIKGTEALIYAALDKALQGHTPIHVWGPQTLTRSERIARIFYVAYADRPHVVPVVTPARPGEVSEVRRRRGNRNAADERRTMFERWDATDSADVRRAVADECCVRFPRASALQFTTKEIAEFNRRRRQSEPFAPYARRKGTTSPET